MALYVENLDKINKERKKIIYGTACFFYLCCFVNPYINYLSSDSAFQLRIQACIDINVSITTYIFKVFTKHLFISFRTFVLSTSISYNSPYLAICQPCICI